MLRLVPWLSSSWLDQMWFRAPSSSCLPEVKETRLFAGIKDTARNALPREFDAIEGFRKLRNLVRPRPLIRGKPGKGAKECSLDVVEVG